MSMMDDNKQLVRDYFKAFVAADETWWRDHIAPGFKRHDPGLPFEVVGPAGIRKLADALLPGIPDMELPIEDLVAEGEKVLARLRVRGTPRVTSWESRRRVARSTSPCLTCSRSATAS